MGMKENRKCHPQNSAFKPLIGRILPARQINRICERLGPVEHGPRWITQWIDIAGRRQLAITPLPSTCCRLLTRIG